MSGIIITVPGEFSDYVMLGRWPALSGISSLFFLGGSAEACATNHAPGSAVTATAPGGSVVIASDHIECTGNASNPANAMWTNDLDNASVDCTIIAIAKVPQVGTAALCGTFYGASGGLSLFSTFGYTSSGMVSKVALLPDTREWSFSAARYSSATGNLVASRGVAGSLVSTTTAVGTRATNGLGFVVGGFPSTGETYTAARHIAAAAKYRRSISDAELANVYAYCRVRFPSLAL